LLHRLNCFFTLNQESIIAEERLYIEELTEVPVRQLSKFLKFIAKHDLWDELEQHLKDRGCNKLLMSFEPVKAIGKIIEKKSSELVAEHDTVASAGQKSGDLTAMACACNATKGPGGPVTPSDRRLKKDVVYLTTLEKGIKLYSFKYIGIHESYVGVMAQDLLLSSPHRNAVTLARGYYVVDYKALGLKMITLKEWVQSPENIFCALELHSEGPNVCADADAKAGRESFSTAKPNPEADVLDRDPKTKFLSLTKYPHLGIQNGLLARLSSDSYPGWLAPRRLSQLCPTASLASARHASRG
jgi:hypothetical protein